jgi:hypothetical protein
MIYPSDLFPCHYLRSESLMQPRFLFTVHQIIRPIIIQRGEDPKPDQDICQTSKDSSPLQALATVPAPTSHYFYNLSAVRCWYTLSSVTLSVTSIHLHFVRVSVTVTSIITKVPLVIIGGKTA